MTTFNMTTLRAPLSNLADKRVPFSTLGFAAFADSVD